jgi:glucose-6-phosphate isomerase
MSLDDAWKRLEAAAAADGDRRILDLFSAEPQRLQRLALDAAGLYLDLSKQSWSLSSLDAALDLARAAGVEAARERMFTGETVNPSEGRAALHTALRALDGDRFETGGLDATAAVLGVRERVRQFAEQVRTGEVRGATGKPFRKIVHIGIGGSDLGPRLLWDALAPANPGIEVRFVANLDPAETEAALAGLDPAETLVIVVSKSFTTQETLQNAEAARAWLVAGVGEAGVGLHLAAVSTALDRTAAFGVPPERVFGFWDWVGGRYSLWSAVSLSIVIALGGEVFQRLLNGARDMDLHFRGAPLDHNAPVLLALAQVYNRNGRGRPARAVAPYAHRLRRLPAYLQQLEMESNGKSVGLDGQAVTHATAAVVFGEAGTNAQHAYFQQFHQGPDVVPVEFILAAQNIEGSDLAQRKLLANGLAQAEALLVGRSSEQPERAVPGDRPSTTVLIQRLGPETLGALIALYEHKTFVEGVIWGINSFDQWGVELGKTLAGQMLEDLQGGTGAHDPSTTVLIGRLAQS